MTDKKAEFAVAERCIELAEDVRVRAEFDTYLKSYFDTLELLFNVREVAEYWIPTRRLGYLHWRIQNRYKDPTMDLKWASAKVRKLIDTHLVSMGITLEVEEVSILSDDFPKAVVQLDPNPRAIASEMEHAIRAHIKIKMESNPALYTNFNERLERIIQSLSGNWEQICTELEKMRHDMVEENVEIDYGIPAEVVPYYTRILQLLDQPDDETTPLTDENKEALKQVAIDSVELTANALSINSNFWSKGSEVKKLEGQLEDLFTYSPVYEVRDKSAYLTSELMKLTKSRNGVPV